MFKIKKERMYGFFRKTLSNMRKFWIKLEREKYIELVNS